MAQQSEESRLVSVSKDIEYMRKDIGEIKQLQKDQVALMATKADLASLTIRVDANERKISNIQKFQYTASGALAVLAFAVPLVLKYFIK